MLVLLGFVDYYQMTEQLTQEPRLSYQEDYHRLCLSHKNEEAYK